MSDPAAMLPANYDKLPGGCTGKGFLPGQSGNPDGKPKGTVSLRRLLQKKLSAEAGEEGKTIAEQMIDVAVERALAGDFNYFKELSARLEGKPTEKIELSDFQGGLFPDAPDAENLERVIRERGSDEELQAIVRGYAWRLTADPGEIDQHDLHGYLVMFDHARRCPDDPGSSMLNKVREAISQDDFFAGNQEDQDMSDNN